MKTKAKIKTQDIKMTTVCSSCHRLIINEIYVKCVKCKNFQQCLQCFSKGIQNGTHFKTHPVILISTDDNEIYEDGWSIEDEICLLTTLQYHGIDNWDATSYFLGNKTPHECKRHYEQVYLIHNHAPAPQEIVNKLSDKSGEVYELDGSLSNPHIINQSNIDGHRCKKEITFEQATGFMPMRDEYETEACLKSEDLINGIGLSEEFDTEETFKEKLEALVQYSGAVEMRQKMHDFVRDENLCEKSCNSIFNDTVQNVDTEDPFLPLQHIIDKEECCTAERIFEKEKETLEKKNKLQDWIDSGIRTLSEGNMLEMKRDNEELKEKEHEILNSIFKTISDQPSYSNELIDTLLKEEEKEFCFKSKINTDLYIIIKDALILNYIGNNIVNINFLESYDKKFSNIKPQLVTQIANFLDSHGLIVVEKRKKTI